ncbi:MAG: ArnT family glycosyltransferase [Luteolibacter sp.]
MASRSSPADYGLELRGWRPFAVIVAACLLAHIWCLTSQFYLDDPTAIRDSEEIRNGDIFRAITILWTRMGYVLQYRLFGLSEVGVHAVNWLLHTSIACLWLAFCRDWLRGQPGGTTRVAWFAALLFAVHPLASEIPNYARTQDLAWVTLFSILAAWALLSFLRCKRWWKIVLLLTAVAGATLSKGPGMFHALILIGATGLASMRSDQWRYFLRRGWIWSALFAFVTFAGWVATMPPFVRRAIEMMEEPRFLGHALTLTRVFWEFAWRACIPVQLSADHHIQETLIPAGASWWEIPDRVALVSAFFMLVAALGSALLLRRPRTRILGACLLVFIGTMGFRVLYLIPEFMPEYRIYPGMPCACLALAIGLSWAWQRFATAVSPQVPAALLILILAAMSARRSFQWHDLDRLMANVLHQYPAQGRAIWELHRRDAYRGDWQKIVDRQRNDWPRVFRRFIEENRRLAPARELPTGHFALADVATSALYAEALAHVHGAAPAMAEIRRLESHMKALRIEQNLHWNYFHLGKVKVLMEIGQPSAALAWVEKSGPWRYPKNLLHQLRASVANAPETH